MKIELHILQNFAPSNLNRDDTGAPKDCELGGYRRARISSQCQKRAVREAFRIDGLVPEENLAARTKRLVHEVTRALSETHGYDREKAAALARGAIEGIGLGLNKKDSGEDAWKTQYLLYVPRRIVSALAELLHRHHDELSELSTAEPPPADVESDDKKAGKKRAKKDAKAAKREAKAAYPKEVREGVERLLESARGTVDLALFGRFIADKPEWNIDAACQVAHAISTNRVQMDFDFFTAVDDLKPSETAGSDMMGTVQFNSSCYYRYAVLDVDGLRKNLDVPDEGDQLARTSIDAFVRAFLTAIPTGKQNSMAAHNFPSYVLAVVREDGPSVSLTNAFLKPARPKSGLDGDDLDLVDVSIAQLEDYFARLEDAVGPCSAFTWADRELTEAGASITRSPRLADFYGQVVDGALRGRP